MRRSKSKSQLWKKVKITTKRPLTQSSKWSTRSVGANANSMMPKWTLSASTTWREKFSYLRKKSLSTSKRVNSCKMNLKNHLTCTDGANLNPLISTLTSLFRRFNHCKSAWSPKLKRSMRRMSWSRRRKSCTSNWRTFWRSSVDLKLLKNLYYTNSHWRNVLSNSRRWLLKSSISNLKLRSTSSKLSVLIVTWRKLRTITSFWDASKCRWVSFQKWAVKMRAWSSPNTNKCNSSLCLNSKCRCSSPTCSLNNSKICNFRDKQLLHLGLKKSMILKISQFEN